MIHTKYFSQYLIKSLELWSLIQKSQDALLFLKEKRKDTPDHPGK